jgi:uncharacterized protein YfcZ (UPF0381/DUF406 family)
MWLLQINRDSTKISFIFSQKDDFLYWLNLLHERLKDSKESIDTCRTKYKTKKKTDPSQTKAQHRKEISAEQFIRIKNKIQKKSECHVWASLSPLPSHKRFHKYVLSVDDWFGVTNWIKRWTINLNIQCFDWKRKNVKYISMKRGNSSAQLFYIEARWQDNRYTNKMN